MSMCLKSYIVEWVKYQKIISHPSEKQGFRPTGDCEVFVKNLPTKVQDEELLRFFAKAGKVFKIRIMMAEDRVENRGFCYVMFMEPAMAKAAVEQLNDVPYQSDYYLLIENSLNNCRIFMGGIPISKTKEEVWHELIRHGVYNMSDVIMYRAYTDRAVNRGFVFLEFETHEEAAHFRAKHYRSLLMWGCPVIIDWSVPMPDVDQKILKIVKVLHLLNLHVPMTPRELEAIVLRYTEMDNIEKIYKFKNFAFIHLTTRAHAERLKESLEVHFTNSPVVVNWSKPSNKYTSREYRQLKVASLCKSRLANSPPSSSSSLPEAMENCRINQFTPSAQAVNARKTLPRRRFFSESYLKVQSPTETRTRSTRSVDAQLSPNRISPFVSTSGGFSVERPRDYYPACTSPSAGRTSTPVSPSSDFSYVSPPRQNDSESDGFSLTPSSSSSTSGSYWSPHDRPAFLSPETQTSRSHLHSGSSSVFDVEDNQVNYNQSNLLYPIGEYQRFTNSLYGHGQPGYFDDCISNFLQCTRCKEDK